MKIKKTKLANIIREEIRKVIEAYMPTDFSDLSGPEEPSFEPGDSNATNNAIQAGVNAIVEEMYQFNPDQNAVDSLETELLSVLATMRESIENIVSSKSRQ
jgi:hypothetical protein